MPDSWWWRSLRPRSLQLAEPLGFLELGEVRVSDAGALTRIEPTP